MQYDLRPGPHHIRPGLISIRPVRIWSRPIRNSLQPGFDHSVITFDQSTTCSHLHTTSLRLARPERPACVYSLCLTTSGWTPGEIICHPWTVQYFLDQVSNNFMWSTLRPLVVWPCTFFIWPQRGAQRHLSCYVRRGKSHIQPVTFLCMFHSIPESYLYNYPVME